MTNKITVEDFYKEQINAKPMRYKTEKEHLERAPLEQTQVYKIGNKTLVFVAGSHTDLKHPFINLLEKIVKTVKPQRILVERSKTLSIEKLKSELTKPKKEYSEVNYLVDFALKNNISVQGMDIPWDSFYKVLIDKYGYPTALLNGFLLCNIRNEKDKRIYFDIALSYILHDVLNNEAFSEYKYDLPKGMHLIEKIEKDLRKAAKQRIGNKKLEEYLGDRTVRCPYPFFQNCEMNKVATYWDAYRNFSMAETCKESLFKYNNVLAVAGIGHIITLKDSLKKMLEQEFGKVEMITWEKYMQKPKKKMV